jgi:hypothetical protein
MEKFVKDSLMNHMETNQLFTNGQQYFLDIEFYCFKFLIRSLWEYWNALSSVFNCKYTLEKFVEQFRFYFVIRLLNKSNYDEAKRSANYHVRQAKFEYERLIATNMKEDNKNHSFFQNFHNHSFFLHLTISLDVIHHE